MAKYICPQCSKAFIYCKGCALTPDLYKEKGFCSKECYKASKNVAEPIVEEVATIEIEESIVEDEIESATEDIQLIEEEVSVEVLVDAETLVETPIVETTTLVEPAIKEETNTYKKKKNKYKYTSSF